MFLLNSALRRVVHIEISEICQRGVCRTLFDPVIVMPSKTRRVANTFLAKCTSSLAAMALFSASLPSLDLWLWNNLKSSQVCLLSVNIVDQFGSQQALSPNIDLQVVPRYVWV